MSGATITSKGQINIPAGIRRSLGLQAQDRLSSTPMPDGTVVLRAKTQSVMALKHQRLKRWRKTAARSSAG